MLHLLGYVVLIAMGVKTASSQLQVDADLPASYSDTQQAGNLEILKRLMRPKSCSDILDIIPDAEPGFYRIYKSLFQVGKDEFCYMGRDLMIESRPNDCYEIKRTSPSAGVGIYTIYPFLGGSGFLAKCEMRIGEDWLIIQHRFDGSENFNRSLTEYGNGFGTTDSEHWLGLEKVHNLTRTRDWELQIDMEDFHGNRAHARYGTFYVGSASSGFKLFVDGYTGTAGDSLSYHNGQKFSTWDSDQDQSGGGCVKMRQGAWWFNMCERSNLNCFNYHQDRHTFKSCYWNDFNHRARLRVMKMKIRRTRN